MKASHIWITSILCFFLFTFSANPNSDWEVPEGAKKMKNPTEATKQNLAIGKSLYGKHCQSCHGKEGLGDGPKAAELETPSGDFTTEDFQSQTDGELFYKTTKGREDMPSFEKKLSDEEDRWLIINYLRTFAE